MPPTSSASRLKTHHPVLRQRLEQQQRPLVGNAPDDLFDELVDLRSRNLAVHALEPQLRGRFLLLFLNLLRLSYHAVRTPLKSGCFPKESGSLIVIQEGDLPT